MATIQIDGKPYQVKDGQDLLRACLSLGFDIPYFCWHPAMNSVGACRLCAVRLFKDERDKRGRIVMSCMTPAADGTRISVDDPGVKAFRASVIEYLMVNHPHDCPICDEGGECHLQDMTVLTGYAHRRYRGKKRTHRNQNLGPFVNHEMNRCIACYRCVRFYRDFAGGRDFDVFGAHHNVYFGRDSDGVLESEFSGNLVEVCPTGVFIDKTFKEHYTRKWDLQTAPSICVHCGLGCNTIPGERYGTLRRIHNRFNEEVNGYFLCDRGRYGYEFVNSDRRIRTARLRGEMLDEKVAIRHAAEMLGDRQRIIGIGSPRASLEANFTLRALVGPERFYQGVSERHGLLAAEALSVLRKGPARAASLREIREADAALVLGEDVTNVAPMLAFMLRQQIMQKANKIAAAVQIPNWLDSAVREAAQLEKGPLCLMTPCTTRLDDAAALVYHAAPDDLARLGFAVAHAIHPDAPAPNDVSIEMQKLAARVADELKKAERPIIVSGPSCGSLAMIHAAANVAWALCAIGRNARLCYAASECNSVGAALLGGGSLDDAGQALREDKADTVVVLENDLWRRLGRATADAIFGAARQVIVIDHLANATSEKADLLLPAATFAENEGTLVNNEGRAQRFYKVMVPTPPVQESWRWLAKIGVACGVKSMADWSTLDDVMKAMANEFETLRPILDIAPPASYRALGQKIPRQPHRYSGRTAMTANVDVHEPQPPSDSDSPLAFSMEGYDGQPPPALIARYWAPYWNSVQALNKFQEEVGGPLRGGDPGRRLIEPSAKNPTTYFSDAPPVFTPRENEWLIVPLYHIFGSEELSALSRGVAELSPKPYVALGREDAARLNLREGDDTSVSAVGESLTLPVKVISTLPRGMAGLPVELRGMRAMTLPAWGVISRGEKK